MTATEDLAASQEAPPDGRLESALRADGAGTDGTDPSDAGTGRLSTVWLRSHLGLIGLLLVPLALFGDPRAVRAGLPGRRQLHAELPTAGARRAGSATRRVPAVESISSSAARPCSPGSTPEPPTRPPGSPPSSRSSPPGPSTWSSPTTSPSPGPTCSSGDRSISTTAATFGAVSFAFAGYMTGQIVHVDLIEGAAWMPWSAGGGARHHQWPDPPGTVTACHPGMGRCSSPCRSGCRCSPVRPKRSSTAACWSVVYAVGRLVTMGYCPSGQLRALGPNRGRAGARRGRWNRPRRRPMVARASSFLSQSQRAGANYTFFTSGSLTLRLMALLASPFVVGTNQEARPATSGPLQLPEATCYVGVLALIATCSLLLKRWRSRPEARQWWIWYVIAGLGLLSAFGGQTPFGHGYVRGPDPQQRTAAQPKPPVGRLRSRGPARMVDPPPARSEPGEIRVPRPARRLPEIVVNLPPARGDRRALSRPLDRRTGGRAPDRDPATIHPLLTAGGRGVGHDRRADRRRGDCGRAGRTAALGRPGCAPFSP